ncbi:MAG: alpha/beta hydrolase [Candidatus Bathyarchaeia archaeon]
MTFIFIHGAGGTPAVWRLQTAHFKDSVSVELPGHPTGSGLTSITDYAQSVRDQIRHHEWRDTILVGHSMGGAIALELALGNQDLRGLVLVGTGGRLRVLPEFISELRENYEKAVRLIASWSVSPRSDPIIVDRLADDLLKVKAQVTVGDFLACDKFDRMNDLEKVTCRTLIVCGEDDKMTPEKYSNYLREKIRNSKLEIIPGAGHIVMVEKHRAFNQAVERFVASL